MLYYLATPYSKYPGGIESAYMDTCRLAARLLRDGVAFFSPITHCHPVAFWGNIDPLDHAIWLPFNQAIMEKCDCLLIAKMDTWQESYGIAQEIKFFEAAGKAIFHLDPDTLAITRPQGSRRKGLAR